ncbi:SRPBCC family protein [Paenibacillus sp. Marseille-P2973]|uniref:SRPBCC family protein n=1 Tax=Paenibacillus sp. Marseille-P2973 TaxID=1871032 RepID=UPI001B36309B|nr:SRPBCC family protein [Paenibacillus sp. Marseille-P2973]MBQ4899804.1 SRPBCC family protein [Paenibacillus sp. Marseille-P2973]
MNIATIQKAGHGQQGYTATFERSLKHPAEQVWSFLTENDKLKQWFPELSVDELVEGGAIKFDMGNGSFEEMTLLEVKPYNVLEYTWDQDRVRFELFPTAEGCRLLLIEKITRITDHTPRDLAGWHVCLDVIAALLALRDFPSRKAEWEERYADYREAISAIGDSQE